MRQQEGNGAFGDKMAELSKDEPPVSSAFSFFEKKGGTLTKLKLREEAKSEV
jgi:hypothetical protein